MKKFLIALLIILFIAALGLVGFTVWKLNEKIDEQSNKIEEVVNKGNSNSVQNVNTQNTVNTVNNSVSNTATNTTTNTATNTTINNQTTSSTDLEEKIKVAFANRLVGMNDKIKEYRIEGVEILSDEQSKAIIDGDNGQYYKQGDILAHVGYAVSPVEAGNAGNGEISGDWVIHKSACIAYRDGVIVNMGTGW